MFSPLIAVMVISFVFLSTILIYSYETSHRATASFLQAKKISERATNIEELINFTVTDAYLDAYMVACQQGNFNSRFSNMLITYFQSLSSIISDEIRPTFSRTVNPAPFGVTVNVSYMAQYASSNKTYTYNLPAFNTAGVTLWGKYSIACPTPTPAPET